MTRSEISGQQLRRITRLELIWQGRITRVLRSIVRDVIIVLNEKGASAARNYIDEIQIIEGLANVLRDMYVAIGIMSANITARDINRSVRREKKGFGEDPKWAALLIEFFRLRLLSKAVLPISKSVSAEVMVILDKGITEGWSVDRMAFELDKADFPVWMARRIVRTEIGKAQFYGRKIAEDESEFVLNKTWIAAHDSRTRHSHIEVDGKTIPVTAKFRVPRYKGNALIGYDEMDGPGDPEASAGNVINCRCTLVTRAARDENGRLMVKVRSKPIFA